MPITTAVQQGVASLRHKPHPAPEDVVCAVRQMDKWCFVSCHMKEGCLWWHVLWWQVVSLVDEAIKMGFSNTRVPVTLPTRVPVTLPTWVPQGFICSMSYSMMWSHCSWPRPQLATTCLMHWPPREV